MQTAHNRHYLSGEEITTTTAITTTTEKWVEKYSSLTAYLNIYDDRMMALFHFWKYIH